MDDVSLPFALGAGVLSFASPCFLPVVPLFIAYLLGGQEVGQRTRGRALRHSLVFVAGFTVVFVALWASLGLISQLLGQYHSWLRILGGAVLVLMGLHVARLIDIPLLSRSYGGPKSGLGGAQAPGYLRSAMLGLAFGAGWTPCIGPALGAIIGVASVSGGFGHGALLLLAYSVGLGIPFVLVALGADWIARRMAWLHRHEAVISLVAGALLVVTGFLMITNLYTRLSGLSE